MSVGNLILVAGSLLTAGLLASLVATRIRVPGLVVFLAVGMLLGSDGLGLIDFDDYGLARTIGVIALALILFDGGFAAGMPAIRRVLGPAVSLAVLGTVLTAAITGFAATALFGFSTKEGLLVGAILAATDGAAIFALLRGSTLRRRLALTLEGESGLNDPVAVFLVLAIIEWIEQPGYAVSDVLTLLAEQFLLGGVIGVAVGLLALAAFRRVRLATVGLYPVASLATAALAFGGAESVHGSGFLAVYLAGLVVGGGRVPARQTVAAFHQGLGWVAQLTMFVSLGLLVFPAQLDDVAWEGTVLAFILAFAARPAAAALATLPFSFSWAERFLLGWAGLRGAVPVVLATFPVLADIPGSLEFFNIVFFTVVISTLLQGATFEPLAQRLGLTTKEPALPTSLTEPALMRRLGAELLEYAVRQEDAVVGAPVRDLELPRDAVVNVIIRGNEAIPPRGSTRLRSGDRLQVLVRSESAARVQELVSRWRSGPIGRARVRPARVIGREPVFSSWRWRPVDGDAARPEAVRGTKVVDQLRIRRDRPGGLWVLADGRYAVTGTVAAVGSRQDVTDWARRRLRHANPEERAWLQTVTGALAADLPE